MTATGEPTAGRLTDEQLVDWLRIIRSENVGPRTFRQLINRFGGAAAALEALPGLVARAQGGRAIRIAPRDEILREMEGARAMGARFIVSIDPDYPPLLREIDSAPPLIVLRGDAAILQRDGVAIVGARNASASGLVLSERLARGLGKEDFVVVSGLARGIDAVAHRAALESGTIAVLAGGHARPYPSEHVSLIEKIVEKGGAVVSEMPLEWEPRGRDFPRRNRIVSGLSRATIVVEAARRSGSLITARFALEQGRELFAVPGSPLDPRAEGTNDLIRQGATLCSCAEDVVAALAESGRAPPRRSDLFGEGEDAPPPVDEEPLFDELDLFSLQERAASTLRYAPAPPVQPVTADEAPCPPEPDAPADTVDAHALILGLLGPAPVPVDELIRVAGLPAHAVRGVLTELDLAGRLTRHGPNSVSLN